MKFLIQNNLIEKKKLEKIKYYVEKFPHKYIDLIPYIYYFNEEFTNFDYIPIGSTLLTLMSIKQGFKGLFFDPITFTYSCAKTNRSDMLNGENIFTVSEALSFLKSRNKNIFVRPDDDLKQFTGTLINSFECYEWFMDALQCKHGSYKMSPEMKIVFSEPKSIEAEWRWFIIDGEIISGSLYKKYGKIILKKETNNEIISIAKEKAKGWLPHKNCTMDLAKVNKEFKIIEFNCINSSGFYDSDINLILEKMYNFIKTN